MNKKLISILILPLVVSLPSCNKEEPKKYTDTYKLIREVHVDTMINYVFSFNDESNNENTNKCQTAAYKYLISTGLTDNQLEQCIQKLTTSVTIL